MVDDDQDNLTPTRRPRRDARSTGLPAVRATVQQLAWTAGVIVYWNGQAATVPSVSATYVLQKKLATLPAGPYIVRFRRRPMHSIVQVSGPLGGLSPELTDVIPLNTPLIARTLRRLSELRKQPKLLRRIVDDPQAWLASCDNALRRLRTVLDAIAGDDREALSAACLQIGRRSGRRRSIAADASPVQRLLAGWPADVLADAIRQLGAGPLLRLARRCPPAGDPDVAGAVADRLLFEPATLAVLLDHLPATLQLIDRLGSEPLRRLQAAVHIQKTCLTYAIEMTGAVGDPLIHAPGGDTFKSVALQRMAGAYADAVSQAVSASCSPCRTDSERNPKWTRVSHHVTVFLSDLLSAVHVSRHLLGNPDGIRSRRRLIRWKPTGSTAQLFVVGDRLPLTLQRLPEVAGDYLWRAAQPSKTLAVRQMVLAQAAVDLIGDPGIVSQWVDHFSRSWPVDPETRSNAIELMRTLRLIHTLTSPQHRGAVATAVDRLAVPLLERIFNHHRLSGEGFGNAGQSQLGLHLKLLIDAVSAGVTLDQLAGAIRSDRIDGLQYMLRVAPSDAGHWLDSMNAYAASLGIGATSGWETSHVMMQWNMTGCTSPRWARAFVLLGLELQSRTVRLLRGLPVDRLIASQAIADLTDFVQDAKPTGADGSASPAALRESRQTVSVYLPLLKEAAVAVQRRHGDRLGKIIEQAADCLTLARLAIADERREQRPAAIARFASDLLQELRTRPLPKDARPISNLCGWSLESLLVAIARRSPQRLVTLGLCEFEIDWQQRKQAAEAWSKLVGYSPLPELVSLAACREGRTPRAIRMLSRLGLAVRLCQHKTLHSQLQRLADSAAPVVEAGTTAGDAGYAEQLALLRHWHPDGALPERIADVLARPDTLRAELATLSAKADRSAAAEKRRNHLQRILADEHRLADWTRRDLAKLVPAAIDDAVLSQFESLAGAVITSYFARILAAPAPSLDDPGQQRNWDNALRHYFTIEYNRPLLRRLLDGCLSRDHGWIASQPQNRRFLAGVASVGINVDQWLAPMSRTIDLPDGIIRLEIETDPLHVLQMGNYFETCLSEGQINSFATVANAVELNKRVIYVYDHRDVVIGRKLVVMTRQGRLVGFRTYGTVSQMNLPHDPHGGSEWLKKVVDGFCQEMARRCGATLHPYPVNPGGDDAGSEKALALFAKWYNDGPEAFGETVLAAPPRPSKSTRRKATSGRRPLRSG